MILSILRCPAGRSRPVGGAPSSWRAAASSRTLTLPLPKTAWQIRQTSPEVVAEIDALLDHHVEGRIASILNERGCLSGEGKPFHALMVQRIRRDYGLKKRYDRLRAAGMLTAQETAERLGVTPRTVRNWCSRGLLRAHAYNDKQGWLYEHPGADRPVKNGGIKLSKRRRPSDDLPNRANVV